MSVIAPLSGGKQTFSERVETDAIDPFRTSAICPWISARKLLRLPTKAVGLIVNETA
jgi:hypothetical protein